MLRRSLVTALLSLAAAARVGAQTADDSPSLHWRLRIVPVQGEADSVDIEFGSEIASGWIVYASDFEAPEVGPRPARLKLEDSGDYRAVGELESVQSRQGAGKTIAGAYRYRYFSGHAQFRQRVRRNGGARQISGVLSGQSCREQAGLCTWFREQFTLAL